MIDEIITEVLKAEGWDTYTNHPADKGGPTKWGITLKAWSEFVGYLVSPVIIQGIGEFEARDFYYEKYIMEPHFNQLPDQLMPLIVDCGVNHGPRAATKWLQRAVGARQDGVLGPKTLQAIESLSWVRTYARVCAYRIRLYGALVSRNHSQAVFAAGWNNRAAKWVEKLADLWLRG